jgi:hypothetical protein
MFSSLVLSLVLNLRICVKELNSIIPLDHSEKVRICKQVILKRGFK